MAKMRKSIIGKKIAKIDQWSIKIRGRTVWHVDAIVLEDGTRLRPNVVESDDGRYYIDFETYTGP